MESGVVMMKLNKSLLINISLALMVGAIVSVFAVRVITTDSNPEYAPTAAAEAYDVTSSAQSFHFQKTWVHTVRDKKKYEATLEGIYEAPDRTWFRRTGAWYPEEPQSSEVVIIGDRMYVRGIGSDRPIELEWETSGDMPGEFLLGDSEWADPHKILLHVDCLTDVERLKDEDVEEVLCYHYRAKLDTDKYVASLNWGDSEDDDHSTQTINDIKRADVIVEFWAEQENGFIRLIVENWDLHPERSGYVTDDIAMEFWGYNSGAKVVSPVPHPILIPDIVASSQQYGFTVTLVPHVTMLSYLEGELSEILGWRICKHPEPNMRRATIQRYLLFDLGDGEVVVGGKGAGMGGGCSEGSGLVSNLVEYELYEGQRIRAFAVIVAPRGIIRTPCIAFTLVEKVDWNWRYVDFELEPSTDIALPAWLEK
jgi:hypothetical protein